MKKSDIHTDNPHSFVNDGKITGNLTIFDGKKTWDSDLMCLAVFGEVRRLSFFSNLVFSLWLMSFHVSMPVFDHKCYAFFVAFHNSFKTTSWW